MHITKEPTGGETILVDTEEHTTVHTIATATTTTVLFYGEGEAGVDPTEPLRTNCTNQGRATVIRRKIESIKGLSII